MLDRSVHVPTYRKPLTICTPFSGKSLPAIQQMPLETFLGHTVRIRQWINRVDPFFWPEPSYLK